MDFAWFIYTLAIIIVVIAACATSMTVWVLTERRDCLVAAALFLVYALDIGTILFDEYQGGKPFLMDYLTTGLTHPAWQIALKAAIVGLVWLWVMLRFHAEVDRVRFGLAFGAFAVVFALIAPVGEGASVVRSMAYWGLYDVSIIAAFVWGAWRYRHRSTEAERLDLGRHRTFFLVMAALSVVMLAEDACNILLLRPDPSGEMRDFFWHLTERNLTENVLMIAAAVAIMIYNRDVMRVFASHPARSEGTLADERVRGDFEGRLLRYADAHEISERERDVLGLALQGKSTQNIATELFISTGTVKAHMHRIYRKCDVATRQELVNSFWKF